MEEIKKIKPITLTDNESGTTYVLEFNRESVIWANHNGFKPSEVGDNLAEMVPILWQAAFRMHHKSVTKETTNKILKDDLGGLTDALLARLIELYAEPQRALINENEDYSGNAKMTVDF